MVRERWPLAVVFDMDGVLVDSSAIHAESFRRTLAARGLPFEDYSTIAGLRTEAAFRQLLPAGVDDEELRSCVSEKRAHFRKLTGEVAPLMPRSVEAVRLLAERSIALGLATSGSRDSMLAFLKASGLRPLFSTAICCEDVPEAKPAPDLYLRAFADLGIEPRHGLVVEDSAAGLLAAIGAGAPCVLFRPGEDARARHAAKAHAIIDDLTHLLDLCQEPGT